MQHIKLFENFPYQENYIDILGGNFGEEELNAITKHVSRINHPGFFEDYEVESYLKEVCNGDANLCKNLIKYLEEKGLDLDWAVRHLK
jgi:hypothetical protein